ncbi:MAG: DUF4199 domain-containing protein [Bacteroidia bacterium]
MEIEHATSKNQVIIKFSIIYVLANIGMALVMYILEIMDKSWLVTILSLGVNAAILFFAMKSRKNDTLNGFMTYGQGLGTGMLILLFGGLVTAVYTFVFYSYIDPEFIDKILETSRAEMLKKDMSDEQIDQALEMSKKFMSPIMMTIFAYLGSLFFGLIISLVLAAVTKRENPHAAYNKLES